LLAGLIAALTFVGVADAQPVGATFRDCAVCPDMVVVPAGTIVLGSATGPAREQPMTEIAFPSPFAVGKHEITVAEFAAFVAATDFAPDPGCDESPDATWRRPGFAQSEREPVVCLNNEDALRYVDWLTGQAWFTYRLLSEAEWEYAARAGERTMNAGVVQQPARLSPAGSFPANAFGLHDMLGNVAEWTADCDHPTLATLSVAPRMTGNCTQRGVRGGSWRDQADLRRTGSRARAMADRRNSTVGFRVTRGVSAP